MVSRHAGYACLEARLASFKSFHWCKSTSLAETLAVHRFYYVGNMDVVRCFECGVTVHTWLESDDVAVEHFRHSPTCPAGSKALKVPEQMKILLKEMLKKLKILSDEVMLLRRWSQVELDS